MPEKAEPAPKSVGFMQRHHFLLRRLHSLTGVMPIGVFLIVHLTTNSSIVWGILNGSRSVPGHAGAYTFQHEVNFIHSLPALLLIEIFGLWLPIAFHSILGVYYATTGKSNVAHYGYQDNWRYTLQRVSGYVGVLFIFYHVATLRWGWTFLVPGGTKWSAEYAASTMAMALRGGESITVWGIVVSLFYLLGASLLVFHFANGLWTAAITWGLTISKAAQRRWGYACAGLGAGMMVMAWSAVLGFLTLDPAEARAVEEAMLRGPGVEVVAPADAPTTTSAPTTPNDR
ncbi:MAG: succinate dehydrogenase [Phycisphaerales bacterium]|nr:MAG: succinate dehydrogenase [Phycisphaerales bacterium]